MSRKRLSKKQMKGDQFVRKTFDWAHWAETHRNQVVVGAIAAVVLVAGFFVYRGMAADARQEAAMEYLDARQSYFAGNWQLAANDLEGFLDRHGDSGYADEARFFIGEAYYRAGDYEAAIGALEEFLDRHEDSLMAFNARLLLAQARSALGQDEAAVATYGEALEKADDDYERIRVHRELALLHESRGRPSEAVEQYRAILELESEGREFVDAQRKIAELTVEPLGTRRGGDETASTAETEAETAN